MTLNGVMGGVVCVISPNSVALEPYYANVALKCSAVLSLAKSLHIISRNLCKIEGKLLLITNRKSYMGF